MIIYKRLKILRYHVKKLYVTDFYIQNLEISYLMNYIDLKAAIDNELK